MSYCTFNLTGLAILAQLARQVGIDLWHRQRQDGHGIIPAIRWMLPYCLGEKAWQHRQPRLEIGGQACRRQRSGILWMVDGKFRESAGRWHCPVSLAADAEPADAVLRAAVVPDISDRESAPSPLVDNQQQEAMPLPRMQDNVRIFRHGPAQVLPLQLRPPSLILKSVSLAMLVFPPCPGTDNWPPSRSPEVPRRGSRTIRTELRIPDPWAPPPDGTPEIAGAPGAAGLQQQRHGASSAPMQALNSRLPATSSACVNVVRRMPGVERSWLASRA